MIASRVLVGGVSNKTVLVTRRMGDAWVIKQALPKLRTKIDWFSDPARIHREALALQYLPELAPAGTITPLVFEDRENHILAMEAVPEPHENWKERLLSGRVEAHHMMQFGEILGTIQARSIARRDELSAIFDDRQYFESLRIEPYYAYTAQQVPEAAEFLYRLIDTTRATRVALVHGDYSPKNILVRNDRLILLDHEVIHWGDPAFDVGFALAHLLSKAHHLREYRDGFENGVVLFASACFSQVADGEVTEDFRTRCAHHALACLLARVAGRSQMDYLSEGEKQTQRRAVVALMSNPPNDIVYVLEQFIRGIERHADH